MTAVEIWCRVAWLAAAASLGALSGWRRLSSGWCFFAAVAAWMVGAYAGGMLLVGELLPAALVAWAVGGALWFITEALPSPERWTARRLIVAHLAGGPAVMVLSASSRVVLAAQRRRMMQEVEEWVSSVGDLYPDDDEDEDEAWKDVPP